MLDHFIFEVQPMNYKGMHGGLERVFTITIEANGQKHTINQAMSEQKPYESELEWFIRRAVAEYSSVYGKRPVKKGKVPDPLSLVRAMHTQPYHYSQFNTTL